MTEDERLNHAYIGDGVYVEITHYDIILRTGDHRDTHCDNKIHLEESVLLHWIQFLKDKKIIKGDE